MILRCSVITKNCNRSSNSNNNKGNEVVHMAVAMESSIF